MKSVVLGDQIKKHPWLFAGLCVIPSLFPSAMLASDSGLWIIIHALWLTLVGLTGLLLFLCLAFLLKLKSSLVANPRTKVYLTLFAIAWNVIFGFFVLLVFGLSLDHADTTDVINRVLIQIVFGFPIVVLFSLAICVCLIAVVVACVESIIWILQKANPKIKKAGDQP